jgi:hypothetical protein
MAAPRTARALAALAALVATGCSGTGSGGPAASSHSAPTTAPSAPSSGASGTTAGGARPAPAAVAAAVRAAYQTFFAGKSSVRQVQANLQNGARFHATIVEQGKSQYAAKSAARVTSVEVLSAQVAAVTYDILSDGSVVLQNVNGHAVRVEGRWVVAAETFCELLKLQGSAPRACSDPAATALPS